MMTKPPRPSERCFYSPGKLTLFLLLRRVFACSAWTYPTLPPYILASPAVLCFFPFFLVSILIGRARETLIQAVDTCLSSKVVSQNCETISPMAVDAVLGIIDPLNATNVDLRDIKVTRRGISRRIGQGYQGK